MIATYAPLVALALFAALVAAQEAGFRAGRRRRSGEADTAPTGLGAVEGALFGLMGLLIAFTFAGAAERFENRRRLVVQEANAIGTAYLRLDLLPAASQPAVRDLFRRYVDERLAVYAALPDIGAARAALGRAEQLQGQIWRAVMEGVRETSGATLAVLMPLNEMIDLTTTRTVAIQTHPPAIIYWMLVFLALVCAVLAGYGMSGGRSRSAIHVFGFAVILSLTIYVILDMEYPRLGLIRVDAADEVLRDVRANMR
jgi:hypothetical protein